MISVEPIEKILKCVLASGKVEGEKPLSLILIAPVENPKLQFCRLSFLAVYERWVCSYSKITQRRKK